MKPTLLESGSTRSGVDSNSHTFPALRGIQAGRAFYVSMCPLRLLPKIFLFSEEEVPARIRAQRKLNKARIPDIARYVSDNPTDYVFSAITVSVDGSVRFDPVGDKDSSVGVLHVPMSARFIINDGQHRRAGIEEALKLRPELGDEEISVVFFVDRGLKRSQQMFADLNKHAIRPTKSLGILYEHRDPLSQLARELADAVPYFQGLTETEKTTISNRAVCLFTLSSIYQATQKLLEKRGEGAHEVNLEEAKLAQEFWTEVGNNIPEWRLATEKKVASAELRREFIHSHGIALHAIAIAGAELLRKQPKEWKVTLARLNQIDWRRRNSALWEGRATIGGKVSKAHGSVVLTGNLIKRSLGLPLTGDEERVERDFAAGRQGRR